MRSFLPIDIQRCNSKVYVFFLVFALICVFTPLPLALLQKPQSERNSIHAVFPSNSKRRQFLTVYHCPNGLRRHIQLLCNFDYIHRHSDRCGYRCY